VFKWLCPAFPCRQKTGKESAFTFNRHERKIRGGEPTRLKSPFGRLLHLFLLPECDFNLGYQSADDVVSDLEPERKPATALNREVAEVEEKSIGDRNGSGCLPRSDLVRRLDAGNEGSQQPPSHPNLEAASGIIDQSSN
jgi:hypothetical protein